MKTGTIYLVRHGESTGNTRGAFLGLNDPPLTDCGKNQALFLGKELACLNATVIASSPLKRARQTAEVLAAKLDLPVVIEGALIEQDFGLWDGSTLEEVEQLFPRDYQIWIDGPPSQSPLSDAARYPRVCRG